MRAATRITTVATIFTGLGVLTLALLSTGCPGIVPTIEKPTAQYRSVAEPVVDFGGMKTTVGITLFNANAIGIPLKEIRWSLKIGQAKALSGHATFSDKIPAKGSTDVDLEIKVSTLGAAGAIREIARGVRDYELSAEFKFSSPIGPLSTFAKKSGRF